MSSSTFYYVHRPLGQQVEAIGGSYELTKEERFFLNDGSNREVLYVVGHGLMDSSCCGVGGCGYAIVQGVILGWKSVISGDGLPMTEVVPVRDEEARARLSKEIKTRELVHQVSFR